MKEGTECVRMASPVRANNMNFVRTVYCGRDTGENGVFRNREKGKEADQNK